MNLLRLSLVKDVLSVRRRSSDQQRSWTSRRRQEIRRNQAPEPKGGTNRTSSEHAATVSSTNTQTLADAVKSEKKKRQSNRPTGQKTARDRQMSGKRREIFGDNTRACMGASPAHVSYVLRCTPSGAGSSGAAKYAVNLTLGGLSTPIDGN